MSAVRVRGAARSVVGPAIEPRHLALHTERYHGHTISVSRTPGAAVEWQVSRTQRGRQHVRITDLAPDQETAIARAREAIERFPI